MKISDIFAAHEQWVESLREPIAKGSPAAMMMEKISQWSSPHPWIKGVRRDGTILFALSRLRSMDSRTLYLSDVYREGDQKGNASATLKRITDAADRYGVILKVDAKFTGPVRNLKSRGDIPTQKLMAWYERNGFVKVRGAAMTRLPKEHPFDHGDS